MKYGVIDIGSNSVRLMISNGVSTQYKILKTTRLAEGLGEDKLLKIVPMERTVKAICELYEIANQERVDKIFIFATAAVRQAKNRQEFLSKIQQSCGLVVDVVSGEKEAELGLLGALGNKDGGVIDIGGASTEIALLKNNKIVYLKSINLGAVSLTDLCGQDRNKAEIIVKDKIKEFGVVDGEDFYSIGGTSTTLGAVLQELEVYLPEKVDGFVIKLSDLELLTERVYNLTIEERMKLKGLQPERAKVIANGCLILLEIMRYLKKDTIIVSEKDNLEGYLEYKLV